MANYVLLYTGGAGMDMSEEARQQVMEEWMVWYGQLGPAIVDGGNPFSPVACSIDSDGNLHNSPVGVPATGYTIISADSMAAATEMCQAHPHVKQGGQVSIYETFQIM